MKPLIQSNATNNSARLTPTAVDDATRVALSFLRGLAAMPHVQTTLREVGLTPDEQALGWKLVGNMVGIPDEAPSSNRALSALDMLDADGVSFYKRTEAPLRRLHPAQADYVFASLHPAHGAEAVVVWDKILERLDDLGSSSERKGTRKEDHAALETLETRGITKELRKKYRGYVNTVQQATVTVPTS
jgi:hypothetical protein